jgi:formamidopyrimidine-DNA glycosylase
MPELPDIAAYISALEARIVGQPLTQVRLGSPFLLRTVQPSLEETYGQRRLMDAWCSGCGGSGSASQSESKVIFGLCFT